MDEVFWSNVVKRWSDASENVILLKKELAKVQEECSLYRNALDGLRQLEVREPGRDDSREEHCHWIPDADNGDDDGNLRDELKDAETGLRRAKEEYRKMQKDLVAAAERIKELTEENERLTLNHRLEIEKQRNIYERILCSSHQQLVLRPEASFSQPISTATPAVGVVSSQVADTHHELSQQSDHSDVRVVMASSPNPGTANSLERQIETIHRLTQEREVDSQGLCQELAITREKLQKAEESKKVLLASIVKLQDIARHSSHGALQPLSSNHFHQFQSDSGRLSAKYANSSRSSSRAQDCTFIASPDPTTLENGVQFRNLGEQPSVENILSISLVSSSYLPPEREKSIGRLPFSTVKVDNTHNVFDREFLKTALRGEVQSLTQRLPENQTAADRKTIFRSYLCPTLNHHPWCPSVPGQHGFIFVGLGKEKESYKVPVFRNLFVGLPKSESKGRIFRYLGKYRVHRVKHLTVEEWEGLSADVKFMYAKLTKDKAKDPRSLDDIIAAYDSGELSVPCVQLQYVSFDDALFSTLISQRPATTQCQ